MAYELFVSFQLGDENIATATHQLEAIVGKPCSGAGTALGFGGPVTRDMDWTFASLADAEAAASRLFAAGYAPSVKEYPPDDEDPLQNPER